MPESIESIVERTCSEQGVTRFAPPDVLERVARVVLTADRRAVGERAA